MEASEEHFSQQKVCGSTALPGPQVENTWAEVGFMLSVSNEL